MTREPAKESRPALVVGPRLLVVAAVVTGLVVVLTWCAPYVPVERGREWERVQLALGVEAGRTLPGWWTTSLFLVAAVAAWAAAGAGRRPRRIAWVLAGLAMVWMSFDHALAVHENLGKFTGDVLPQPVASRLSELVLAIVLLPTGAVLVASAARAQRVLLMFSPLLYAAGQLVVGGGFVDLALSPHRTALAEATLEWAGVLLLALAASLEGLGAKASQVT